MDDEVEWLCICMYLASTAVHPNASFHYSVLKSSNPTYNNIKKLELEEQW